MFVRAGKRIEFVRKYRKMRISELSDSTGISMATLSSIENGGSAFTSDALLRIARAIKVDHNYIMEGIFDRIVDSDLEKELRVFEEQFQ